jgi:hypothetical protein
MSTLFNISNLVVLPFWLIMIALPRWDWAKKLISSPWIVLPPVLIYAALVLPGLPGLLGQLANPNLDSIAALLGTPAGATVSWTHFLAFDLFVGRWAYLDAIERRIPAWLMAPVLFLTLMFGPLGLLAYLIVRLAVRRP